MKKVRIIILFMSLFLGMFFIMPAKVFASDDWLEPEDWFNHISQFDFGFAKGEVDDYGSILIVEEPSHEYDGWYIDYYVQDYEKDSPYFEPELIDSGLHYLLEDSQGILWYLEEYFEDFDGYFYWNFEQKYWQVGYYDTSELGYYIQRVEELENEISSLEDEIQQLEDALDFEYDRGYTDGYEIGYNEGLLVENNDITKWFVPLVVIIIIVGVIEPILLIKRRG